MLTFLHFCERKRQEATPPTPGTLRRRAVREQRQRRHQQVLAEAEALLRSAANDTEKRQAAINFLLAKLAAEGK
jgi:hypothetical protein